MLKRVARQGHPVQLLVLLPVTKKKAKGMNCFCINFLLCFRL